ncbi:uncharacterized protein LOC108733482 [Agrilus planipennis]|uniref:Uncharacterized protein LOC108733482 n=1 Tax=Agrilus planipennis TaxID=224129 RepID=A0A1W4WI85_AGRPL|nr:uncharacterized protein LOC108733482 [Agrilus planipennis]
MTPTMNQFYKTVILLIVCLYWMGTVTGYSIDRNIYQVDKSNDRLQKYQGLSFEEKVFRIVKYNPSTTSAFPLFDYMMKDNEIEEESPKPQVYYNAHQYGPYLHNERDQQIIITRK